MRHFIRYAAVAAGVVVLWASVASGRSTVSSHIGAVQQSMGRTGHVWAVGLTSGGSVSLGLSDRWRLRLGLEWSRLWDDTTSTSLVKFANRDSESSRAWTTTSLRVMGEYHPEFLESVGSFLSLGLGTATWDVRTYPDYESITVPSTGGHDKDFSASELLVVGGVGIEPALASNIHARIGVQADYFTGVGASFPADFRDNRSHFLVGLTVGLSYSFGAIPGAGHRSDHEPLIIRPARQSALLESEPETEPVEASSPAIGPMPSASDLSVAPVGYQGPTAGELFASLAPETPRVAPTLAEELEEARRSDPMLRDGDNDGVPDALDHCPATPKGYSVDESGCMKLTAQDQGFTLRVEYESGTSDPDSVSRLVLVDLALRLIERPDLSVMIEGHTDNIGTDMNNLLLSQKRATKIKEYLVELGVPPERITAVGRGEAVPVASNGTASGRKANRRIEITYVAGNPASASAE